MEPVNDKQVTAKDSLEACSRIKNVGRSQEVIKGKKVFIFASIIEPDSLLREVEKRELDTW